MAGAMTVLIMAFLMGASSFGFGMLPLTVQFSKTRLAQLSAFGIGLLLGAGLGVVIPEGVESVTPHNGSLPTHTIALSLIGGFAAMMLIEQLLPGHAHVGAVAHDAGNKPSNGHNRRFSVAASTASDNELDLDHEIELLESSGGGLNARDSQAAAASRARALPLSMGLVIHCAADGLALGASAVPVAGSGQAEAAALPLIVFLALVIHKAPTALALSTSLLAAGLPKVAVRKHLIAFSLSSPLSAICTYYALSFLGGSGGSWTGIALLVSGGSFLYVATVLQPISSHGAHGAPAAAEEISKAMRLLLVVAGMLTPIIVTALVGHDEGHHASGPPANWPTPPDGHAAPSA